MFHLKVRCNRTRFGEYLVNRNCGMPLPVNFVCKWCGAFHFGWDINDCTAWKWTLLLGLVNNKHLKRRSIYVYAVTNATRRRNWEPKLNLWNKSDVVDILSSSQWRHMPKRRHESGRAGAHKTGLFPTVIRLISFLTFCAQKYKSIINIYMDIY